MLFRRNFLVIFLIFGQSLKPMVKILVALSAQLIYLPTIVYLRAFKRVTDNIIDIMNEVYFLVLLIILIFYNKESHWDLSTSYAYLYLIMSNFCVILTLMLGTPFHSHLASAIITIIKKVKKKWQKKDQEPIQVSQICKK